MLTLILGVSTLLAGQAAAACSQSVLEQGAEAYLKTVKSGQISLPLSPAVSFTENFKKGNIRASTLTKPVKVAHSRSIYDPVECATYTELIAPDNDTPTVIGTQIHYDPSGNVIKLETITTTKGDWLFNPKNTLSLSLKESRPEIPAGKRDSRATIQAAADAYLDYFGKKGITVPYGKPCTRVEGGANMPICSAGMMTSGMPMSDRRYVIDQAAGTVDVFVKFGGSMPDSHEFRVENGKIRYVHTLTKMGGKGL